MSDEIQISDDELPDSWIRAPFSSVTVDPVQRVPGEKEKITYIDIGSVDRDTKTIVEPQSMLGKDAPSRARKVIQSGDVLVSTVRPNLNAVALVESQYDGQFASTGFDVLRSSVVDPRWLFYSVRTPEFLDRMSELVQGALYPAVRSKDIRSFVIPIAPLAEQKRIADKLEAVLGRVDACRARLDRVPALLKRFRQSVLASATSGGLTAEWRTTNQNGDSSASQHKTAFVLLDAIKAAKLQWTAINKNHNEAARINKRASAFGKHSSMPVDGVPNWASAKLEDVVLAVVDCHNKTAPYSPEGIPLVRTSNIRDGRVVWEDMRFVSDATYKFWSKRCSPESGDIIFTREAPMGEAAIVPEDTKVCLGQRTMLIRPLEALCSSRFLLISLMAPGFRSRSLESAVGTGVKHLRVGDVSNLEITLPPLPEQQEIVRRVEDLFAFADRIEARLAVAQKTIERLTPSVLAKAFRGELVSRDPNDEPATALLARLRSQAAAKPVKATRKTRK